MVGRSASGFKEIFTAAGVKEREVTVSDTTFRLPERYHTLRNVGKGSYGVVCSAKDSLRKTDVAIKKIAPMSTDAFSAKRVLREIRLMRHLGTHENIVTLVDLICRERDDELYIVMELMAMDLHKVINSSQELNEHHYRVFMIQILKGVAFLHENGIIHRDLKPGNILVTLNCDIRITDFGLARVHHQGKRATPVGQSAHQPAPFSGSSYSTPSSSTTGTLSGFSTSDVSTAEEGMTEHVVTRWYRPPELMLSPNGHYSFSVDLWCVGCILAELLGRKPIFPGTNFKHQLLLIFEVLGSPKAEEVAYIRGSQARSFLQDIGKVPPKPFGELFPNASHDVVDLLGRLLKFDPEKREDASTLINCPFLAPIRNEFQRNVPASPRGLDFSFERSGTSRADLKALILQEASYYAAKVEREIAAGHSTYVVRPAGGSQSFSSMGNWFGSHSGNVSDYGYTHDMQMDEEGRSSMSGISRLLDAVPFVSKATSGGKPRSPRDGAPGDTLPRKILRTVAPRDRSATTYNGMDVVNRDRGLEGRVRARPSGRAELPDSFVEDIDRHEKLNRSRSSRYSLVPNTRGWPPRSPSNHMRGESMNHMQYHINTSVGQMFVAGGAGCLPCSNNKASSGGTQGSGLLSKFLRRGSSGGLHAGGPDEPYHAVEGEMCVVGDVTATESTRGDPGPFQFHTATSTDATTVSSTVSSTYMVEQQPNIHVHGGAMPMYMSMQDMQTFPHPPPNPYGIYGTGNADMVEDHNMMEDHASGL